MAEKKKRDMQIRVQNVVASATLDQDINLITLASAIEGVEYEPEQFPGVVYRLKEPKTATLIFGSGKMVCTGAKSPEKTKEAIYKIVENLKAADIEIRNKPKIQVQNIVATANLGVPLNLNAIALGLPNSEYEPEQFPGLIYRLDKPKVVLLLFGSGKIVCTGAKQLSDIDKAVERVVEDLKKLGLME